MATKKYNFNAIRPAIEAAWRTDNKKPISRDMLSTLGIDESYLIDWQSDVRALQTVVEKWVDLAWNAKFDEKITDADITAAKNLVYPKWKEILHCAEEKKLERKLKVSEFDIDALFKFAWDFKATGVGTALCHADTRQFCRKVETLVGCIIAQNAMLTDKERDILDKYNKALKSIESAVTRLREIEESRKQWELIQSQIPTTEEHYIKFIKNQLHTLKDEEDAVKEKKVVAESNKASVAKDAESILNKIKYTKA